MVNLYLIEWREGTERHSQPSPDVEKGEVLTEA